MPKQFFTRESAIDYLLSDVRFRELYSRNPADLGKEQAMRYANKLFDIEASGGELRSIGELRGHLVSEHHRGRGRKPNTQGWQPEQKVPHGWFSYGPRDTGFYSRRVIVRVTSGERAAVKALQHDVRDIKDTGDRHMFAQWLREKRYAREWQVTMNITGGVRGQFTRLFEHGWSNKAILEAAGYREDGKGNWHLARGGMGLRKYLLNLVNSIPRRSGDPSKWRAIKLYEIYLWREPVNERIDTAARTRPVTRIEA